MTEANTAQPIEPTTPAPVDTAAAEEAEYQAAMAKIKKDSGVPTEEEAEAGLSAEEKEYRAAMKKARGTEKKKEPVHAKEAGLKNETPKAAEEKPQTEKRVVKLKRQNGEEFDFDISDEPKLQQTLQKIFGIEERSAAQVQKITQQATNLVKALQENTFDALMHPNFGINQEQLIEKAAEFLWKHKVSKEMMSPEQRAIAERDEKIAKYENAEKQREAQKKAQEEAEKAQRAEARKTELIKGWSEQFKSTLEAGDVPKTDFTLYRMAMYMRNAVRQGRSDIKPADVLPMVREDYRKHLQELFRALPEDKLLEYAGKEGADKIRKANLRQYENKAFEQTNHNREPVESGPAKGKPSYGSIEEMQRAMGIRR